MIWIAIAILAGSVALDQITKAIVVSRMELYEEVPFLPGFIRFYRTENTGAAFSLLKDNPWILMIFTLIAMGVVGFMLVKFFKRHPLLTVSLCMILGGGISNLIDRIVAGKVVDFIDFDFLFFGFFDFAVFNVADMFVTCGALCLAVYILAIEPKVEKKLRAAEAAESGADGTGELSHENEPESANESDDGTVRLPEGDGDPGSGGDGGDPDR